MNKIFENFNESTVWSSLDFEKKEFSDQNFWWFQYENEIPASCFLFHVPTSQFVHFFHTC